MRFLMVSMQYPLAEGQSYLTTELADGLVAAGHEVDVLHLDWAAPPNTAIEEFASASGVRVVRCGPKYVSLFGPLVQAISKFALSGRHAAKVASRHFHLPGFDAFIAWMPATAIAPLVRSVRRARIPNRLLFIWDFFPDHYHEIGRIPGGLPLWIARASEQRLIRHFTAIICTLAENANYLKRRFCISPDQRVLVTPVWGQTTLAGAVDRAAVRARHQLPPTAPIAVFGGQLSEGRGFEQMLAAAEIALKAGSNLSFLFVGDGPLAPKIRECAGHQANVLHRPSLARNDYLELLGACEVGMVATVPGVSSFSMPSKTIDYLRAGLPVVAAVEHGSEFIRILDHYRVGAGVPFARADLFCAQARRLAARGLVREAAERCLEDIFDVHHAVATVLDAACRGERPIPRRAPQRSSRRPRHKRSGEPVFHRWR